MASICWDAHGILFIDYLEKGKTINSDYYMALLERLSAKTEDYFGIKDESFYKKRHRKVKEGLELIY